MTSFCRALDNRVFWWIPDFVLKFSSTAIFDFRWSFRWPPFSFSEKCSYLRTCFKTTFVLFCNNVLPWKSLLTVIKISKLQIILAVFSSVKNDPFRKFAPSGKFSITQNANLKKIRELTQRKQFPLVIHTNRYYRNIIYTYHLIIIERFIRFFDILK